MVNIKNSKFYSPTRVDQILETFSGSFVSTAPSSTIFSTTSTDTKSTNITDSTYFVGIYSIDGGTTWNDFCNSQVVLPPGIFFPFLTVTGKSKANQFIVTATNYYNIYTSSGSSYTVMYKVALIAKPNQGVITPQPIGTDVFLNSKYNYQKIVGDTDNPVPFSGTSISTVINHNLGYEPKIRQYVYMDADSSIVQLTGNNAITTIGTNSITINVSFISSISGILYTRVYYDN